MRKKQSKKRPILPDPKFNDQLVTRFVNNLMLHGKKSTAYNLFYDAIEIVEKRKQVEEKTAIEVWKDALLLILTLDNFLPEIALTGAVATTIDVSLTILVTVVVRACVSLPA